MLLIIGLGNPGKEYEKTRHNTGFILLDKFQEKWNFPQFKIEKKFNAEISTEIQNGEKIILAKPQTFMNLSGDSVRKLMDFYKLTPQEIIIIHDALDILLGTFKIATNSSSAGHNGVQNIIEKIGTQELRRFRIGLGEETTNTPNCRLGAHDFVLGKLSDQETEKITALIPEIEQKIFS
ncbi:MAG: aminoacyl-tRNA hydrolase [Candidatus Moranbacteria bacterium]|jgi:PTH1 family peptidyl-tRNA hydrolase|nr:aminoacyl-tRNA hydrolase [Candidatus Moranbacteria bacterium]